MYINRYVCMYVYVYVYVSRYTEAETGTRTCMQREEDTDRDTATRTDSLNPPISITSAPLQPITDPNTIQTNPKKTTVRCSRGS
jgi:hypothetical protein